MTRPNIIHPGVYFSERQHIACERPETEQKGQLSSKYVSVPRRCVRSERKEWTWKKFDLTAFYV